MTSRFITAWTWLNRSKPAASCSVKMPAGRRSSSSTSTAPWARLWSRLSPSPRVLWGDSVIGVSNTGWRLLTNSTTVLTTSRGMSCGRTTRPPLRATVSAIRRPAIAVMFDTTTGMLVPIPSGVDRSTDMRESTDESDGTMNTSL